ncbi:Exodeoxyribonuclease III [Candidatus Providencia siddallii]|uniref:Exodeoxyribonuclease III n=1 Tax=Candidatus Providencia siddallii TaxID=1715285 RepID=A0A0M6W7F6_9GAMM|nr:Exodeoxyribonuclease III [Candidatus Providencia siddallii]
MKFISFNINGLRAHLHQLKAIIEKHKPEIIGLQEIKVNNDMFPFDEINKLGYYAFCNGQKAYYGVAILSKKKPFKIIKGLPYDEINAQSRVITLNIYNNKCPLVIVNAYFPQGDNRSNQKKFFLKKVFYQDLLNYVIHIQKTKAQLIVMGDMNISPNDLDIGIGDIKRNLWLKKGKCSFLPEEREWLSNLLNSGNLIDTYRAKNPDENSFFSWFDYRFKRFNDNCGLRIDLILVCKNLIKYCIASGIDYEIRGMIKPSDHAPVWSEFDIKNFRF